MTDDTSETAACKCNKHGQMYLRVSLQRTLNDVCYRALFLLIFIYETFWEQW